MFEVSSSVEIAAPPCLSRATVPSDGRVLQDAGQGRVGLGGAQEARKIGTIVQVASIDDCVCMCVLKVVSNQYVPWSLLHAHSARFSSLHSHSTAVGRGAVDSCQRRSLFAVHKQGAKPWRALGICVFVYV